MKNNFTLQHFSLFNSFGQKTIVRICGNWVSGFVDGEGSFNITRVKNTYQFEFKITQHYASIHTLVAIQLFFKVGSVVINDSKANTMKYHITKVTDLVNVIIPFFDMFPLRTSKNLNYQAFKKAVLLVANRNSYHTSWPQALLSEIANIKASMNRARSLKEKLEASLLYNTLNNPINSSWLLGFIDGEGSFAFNLHQGAKGNQAFRVNMNISQNSYDRSVLIAIANYFNLDGYVYPKLPFDLNFDTISKFNDLIIANPTRFAKSSFILNYNTPNLALENILIPLVKEHGLATIKQQDFNDWLILLNLLIEYNHRKASGSSLQNCLDQMNTVRNNMNSLRFYPSIPNNWSVNNHIIL